MAVYELSSYFRSTDSENAKSGAGVRVVVPEKRQVEEVRVVQSTIVATVTRRLLFISHANPEDNDFAKWLATQLAVVGYEVWCDVTDLLGGERFWSDIQEAIEAHAFRMLFVSTRESNQKAGTLRELELAHAAQAKHQLRDFVVPLKVDNLPFDSAHETIRGINHVRFDGSWAYGLSQLIALLERERAPKGVAAGPACVTEWYRRSLDSRRQVVVSNNRYFSNWFEFDLPKRLYFHRFSGSEDGLARISSSFSRPRRLQGRQLVTFSSAAEVQAEFGAAAFPETLSIAIEAFIQDGSNALDIVPYDAVNIVSDLVRQAWESTMASRGLGAHRLASGPPAWFFRHGVLEKNRAYFEAPGGRRAYRQMVGYKSKRTTIGTRIADGHWHYAVSAKSLLRPFPRLTLRHHVIFTDDGHTPWLSAARMQRARRSVCKNWWNDTWRDRLSAFCSAVADGRRHINLGVSQDAAIRLSMAPMSFTSPWTYYEDSHSGIDESSELELVEDLEDEEDNETGD